MEEKTAKFELSQLLSIGMVVIVLGIAVAIGLNITSDFSGNACESDGLGTYINGSCFNASNYSNKYLAGYTEEFNATRDTTGALGKLPAKIPLIITIVVAVVIITLLIRWLYVRR